MDTLDVGGVPSKWVTKLLVFFPSVLYFNIVYYLSCYVVISSVQDIPLDFFGV